MISNASTSIPRFNKLSSCLPYRLLTNKPFSSTSQDTHKLTSHLVPNYGDIIPFHVKNSIGPYLIGNRLGHAIDPPSALICNCAGYSSATTGFNPKWFFELIERKKVDLSPLHVSRKYHVDPLNKLAKKLEDLTTGVIKNPHHESVKFCPCLGGSDAVEAAIKLALKRGYDNGVPDGKQEIIFLKHPFHGRTRSVIGTGESPEMHEGFNVSSSLNKQCPINDIETLYKLINKHTVAIVVEPIQGEPGVIKINNEFAKALRHCCDQVNALLISDEVQTGFYRTGINCFASALIDLKPDVIVLGKALGGMLALSGFVTPSSIASTFSPGTHGATYAGNQLSCELALENIDQYEHLNFGATMQHIGDEIKSICEQFNVGEVRGDGAMLAWEFNTDSQAKLVAESLFTIGIDLNLTIQPNLINPQQFEGMHKILGTPISGISLAKTQQNRTLRISPTFLTEDQLAITLKMYDAAINKVIKKLK